MLTGVNVRTASATAPSATTAMLVVQPTLTRRWLERDTDRNCIEHLRCDQMMEPRHCRPGPEGRGRQCFRAAWSEVGSAAFGRQDDVLVRPRGTGRYNDQSALRPGRAVSTQAISPMSAQRTLATIPHTTHILDQYVQRQGTRA